MDMEGSRALAVTQQQAWDALNDPEVLKTCIPGCEKIDKTGDNQYVVVVAVKIGPVQAKFNGKLTLSDVNAPASYTIAFDGQGGAAGFGKGSSDVSLQAEGQSTRLRYTANAQVGGKMAQIGSRLIDATARKMTEDFFKALEAQLRPAPVPADEATALVADHAVALPAASESGVRSLAWLIAALLVVAAVYFIVR